MLKKAKARIGKAFMRSMDKRPTLYVDLWLGVFPFLLAIHIYTKSWINISVLSACAVFMVITRYRTKNLFRKDRERYYTLHPIDLDIILMGEQVTVSDFKEGWQFHFKREEMSAAALHSRMQRAMDVVGMKEFVAKQEAAAAEKDEQDA